MGEWPTTGPFLASQTHLLGLSSQVAPGLRSQPSRPSQAAFRKRGFTAAHAESLLSSQGFQGVRVAGTHSLAAHGHNTPVVVITASKL